MLVSGMPAHIMAEMVDVKVSGVVRAAPDKVFRFLADLENWPRWQSDMQTTTLVEGQRASPGPVIATSPRRWARDSTQRSA